MLHRRSSRSGTWRRWSPPRRRPGESLERVLGRRPAARVVRFSTVSLVCKQLSATDLPVMHGLLALFGEAFGEPDTYQGAVPSDGYLTKLLRKPHFIALAALEGDAVIGGLAAYELEKFERARSEIYIYDLAVSEAHRRRGV